MTEISVTIDLNTKVVCDDFKSRIVMIPFHFAVTYYLKGLLRTGTLGFYNVKHNLDS